LESSELVLKRVEVNLIEIRKMRALKLFCTHLHALRVCRSKAKPAASGTEVQCVKKETRQGKNFRFVVSLFTQLQTCISNEKVGRMCESGGGDGMRKKLFAI
jgi:hypothetical protein